VTNNAQPALLGEELLRLSHDLPALVEELTGRRPHRSVAWRWAKTGILGPDGKKRVFLQYIRIGGTVYTSRAAVERFIAELSGQPVATDAVVPRRRRTRATTKAILARHGVTGRGGAR
jgi:hypothetical protein